MSTANRIIKNTGFLYAKMGITMFISLYTTRLILNSLGAEDFGIFNIVGGAIAMLGFLNAAMASATQRFMSYSEGEGNKEKQKQIFNISVVLHFLIALAAGVLLVIAGYFFFNGILNIPADRIFAAKVVYGSLIVSTMFTVMTVPYDATMNAHENMKYYAIVGIIESFLKLAVAFIVVYTLSDKLIVYGILMAGIPLITMTIMRMYCHKHYEECVFRPRVHWHKGLMKEMTGFAGWNFIGTLSSLVGNCGIGIVVNHFFGVIVNAAMGIVGQLNGQLMAFSNNITKALNPVIIKREGGQDRQGMLRLSFTGCKITFLSLAFFAIPVLIETPFILKIWLREVPEWTILFLRLQLIRSLLELLTLGLGTSLAAAGYVKYFNICTFFTNLLPLPILWWMYTLGFPPYWLFIVGIAFMVLLFGALKLYFCKKYCGLSIRAFIKEVIQPSLSCFLLTYLAGYLPIMALPIQEGWIRFIISTFCSVVSFILILYSIALTTKERSLISGLTKALIKKILLHT